MRRPTWTALQKRNPRNRNPPDATTTATLTTYLSTRQRAMTYLDCQTLPNHDPLQRAGTRRNIPRLPNRSQPYPASTYFAATHRDCHTGTGLAPPGPTGSYLDCQTIPSLDTLYHAETRLPHLVALATLRSSCSRLLVIGALALVIAVLETPLSKLSASN